MSETELPDFVEQKIEDINTRTEIPSKEIRDVYLEIFNDPFIQEDEQFKTDEERHLYAKGVLWSRYTARPPVKDFILIPLGFASARVSKKTGRISSEIYALVIVGKKAKNRRIVLRDTMIGIREDITYKAKYVVKLGEFEDGGDLIADDRSKFKDPKGLNITAEKIIKLVHAKRIKVKEAKKFPSKVGSTGYTVRTDWRVVRGFIVGLNQGKTKNGGDWGVYNIADDTVNGGYQATAEGNVVGPLSCWIAPQLMAYGRDSEVDILGTVSVDDKGIASMNAYMVFPIHARPKEIPKKEAEEEVAEEEVTEEELPEEIGD